MLIPVCVCGGGRGWGYTFKQNYTIVSSDINQCVNVNVSTWEEEIQRRKKRKEFLEVGGRVEREKKRKRLKTKRNVRDRHVCARVILTQRSFTPPPATNSFSLNLRVRWSSGNLLAAVGAEHERRGLRTSVTNFSLKSRFWGVSREAEIVPRKERTDQKFIVFRWDVRIITRGT